MGSEMCIRDRATTITTGDSLILLASGNNSSDAVDIGIYGLYDVGGTDKYSGFFRDADSSGKWRLFKDLQTQPTTTVNTSGTGYAKGTLVADIEGAVTGNASTATALATGRTIGMTGDVVWTSASFTGCLLYTSPSPRDLSTSRMPSSA